MIKGIGIDLIELNRIAKAYGRNARFVERILTKNEQIRFNNLTSERRKIEYLAGRFAAKEAFAKAVGTGIGKLSFQHIEVLSSENGAPTIRANGFAPEKTFISISHSEAYAIAKVIITT